MGSWSEFCVHEAGEHGRWELGGHVCESGLCFKSNGKTLEVLSWWADSGLKEKIVAEGMERSQKIQEIFLIPTLVLGSLSSVFICHWEVELTSLLNFWWNQAHLLGYGLECMWLSDNSGLDKLETFLFHIKVGAPNTKWWKCYLDRKSVV